MNSLILTILVSLVVKVAAEPSPWLYEKIHLLSDNPRKASSPDRVKKFQIPAANATHQNGTKTETSSNNTLDAQHKDDNQTDAVAKLYSFLKFTSQAKDNTTAAGVSSDSAARNGSLLKTSTVADTASPSGNNASLSSNVTFAGKNVTQGLSAANGSKSAASAFDSKLKQHNLPAINVTAPFTSQTTNVSYRPSVGRYVGDKGAAAMKHLSSGTSAKAVSVQPLRSYVPNQPLGYGAYIPGSPNNYLSNRWPAVPVSRSRSYVTTWPHSYIPNNKAVFRAPVPGLRSYAPNNAVLRSPIPGQLRYTPNHAVLRPAIPRQSGYTPNHAVLRSPIPGHSSYTLNHAVLRPAFPGQLGYTPNHAALRSPIPRQPRYMPNRLPVHAGIPSYTPYLRYTKKHSVPNSFPLAKNTVQHSYTPYRGPIYGSGPGHLQYARRQNVPYSYPFPSKKPSLPGQKRAYMYGNVGQRSLPHAPLPRLTRPAYIGHQAPARRIAYRG